MIHHAVETEEKQNDESDCGPDEDGRHLLRVFHQQQLDEATLLDGSASAEPNRNVSSRAVVIKVTALKEFFEFDLLGASQVEPVRSELLADNVVLWRMGKK